MTLVQFATYFFSTLTLLSQIAVIVVVFLIIFKKGKPLLSFLATHAILLSFIIVLTATLGSLFYSEIAGYEPCKLCWLQRICMYPMVIVFLMALINKERRAIDSTFILSIIGLCIAGYHYLGQFGLTSLPCSAVGYSVSCAKIFFLQFGYITFPLMALTAFLLVIVLYLLHRNSQRVTI